MTYIQLLRGRHINVFDLIKFARAGAANFSPTIAWTITLRDFGSAREFFDYCRGENKVCAGWIGKANPLFQWAMNRFFRAIGE